MRFLAFMGWISIVWVENCDGELELKRVRNDPFGGVCCGPKGVTKLLYGGYAKGDWAKRWISWEYNKYRVTVK